MHQCKVHQNLWPSDSSLLNSWTDIQLSIHIKHVGQQCMIEYSRIQKACGIRKLHNQQRRGSSFSLRPIQFTLIPAIHFGRLNLHIKQPNKLQEAFTFFFIHQYSIEFLNDQVQNPYGLGFNLGTTWPIKQWTSSLLSD